MRKIFYFGKVVFTIVRFWFRFCSGRQLFGERKTDATFTRRATRSLDPSKTALRWEMLAGWHRLMWRLGGLYLLGVSSVCLLLWPIVSVWDLPPYFHPSFILWAHAAIGAISAVAYFLRRHMKEYGYSVPVLRRTEQEDGAEKLQWSKVEVEGRRAWLTEKVVPVCRSLAVILNTSIPEREAVKWVTVPKNYREPGGDPVVMKLPSSFTGADEGIKKRLTSSVKEKLGMRSISATWQLEGDAPRVLFSAPPEPPTLVTFGDIQHFLEAMGEWDFFYGVTGTGEGFSVSVSGDTPHGAVSAGSGAGKSELLKGKIMQAGHKGWFTVIMDWKEGSQEWASGLPGVRYLRTVEAIHDMCIALGEEVEWRKAHKDAQRSRVLILAEEWSITAPLLTEYWSTLRATADPEEKKQMPLRSPAITSIMKVIFAGRSLGLFLELVAIRFSARVTNGNADLRESFQVIHMARWKSQTVKMLAPDIKPFPRKPTDLGRWVAVNGDVAVIYQAPLYTDSEAIEWHQSGVDIPASPWSERFEPTRPHRPNINTTQGDQLGHDLTDLTQPAIEARPVSPMKLSDLWEGLEHLGVTLNVLKLAVKRDSTFPIAISGDQFNGYRYSPAEVADWARKRHATRQAERVGRG